MGVENIRVAKSALTDEVFAGYIDKTGKGWRTKKNITADFLKAVIDRWENQEEIISDGTNKWKIRVETLNESETGSRT